VKIGSQDSRLHGRIVTQQALRFLEGNRLEDDDAQQIVGCLDTARRAQFA